VISDRTLALPCLFWLAAGSSGLPAAEPPSAAELVRSAVDYWRGDSSDIDVEMTVRRPDWERSLSMTGWSRGREDSLIRFTAPPKDAGNATLKLGASMWIFTPKPGAPVVWGKQSQRIRDDFVLLEESFFDQDMELVKRLETTKIGPLGGRPYSVVMRMTDLPADDNWTELRYREGTFDLELPEYLFTLSNLSNPRPWKTP